MGRRGLVGVSSAHSILPSRVRARARLVVFASLAGRLLLIRRSSRAAFKRSNALLGFDHITSKTNARSRVRTQHTHTHNESTKMPPRKRKQQNGGAGAGEAAEDAGPLPDRDETARKIQEKLEALDRAGE